MKYDLSIIAHFFFQSFHMSSHYLVWLYPEQQILQQALGEHLRKEIFYTDLSFINKEKGWKNDFPNREMINFFNRTLKVFQMA